MSLALDWTPPRNSTTVRAISQSMKAALRRSSLSLSSRLAPQWTLRLTSRWFITPPRHAQPAAEASLLATAVRHDIPFADGVLRAWQFGPLDAPAILVSHGWGGRGGQFRAMVPRLVEAGYQVWLFDQKGHGQSDGRDATIVDFTFGIRVVHAHILARGVPVAGFIGHSLGGAALAAALAGKDGKPPLAAQGAGRKLVLIAPPASLLRYSRLFARHLGIAENIRDAMQWRLEQRFGVYWQDFELPAAAARIAAGTLIIHDHQDRDVPFDTGLAIARGWPDAGFRRTSGLGHHRILRDAGVVRDVVDFFTGEVRFSPPPAVDEWHSFPGPAPLW